ncbi:MAG: hypothetical protein IPH80_39680 [Myxococcales bacterium]|nr:hypothetical protein [Myxococcales bacterium]
MAPPHTGAPAPAALVAPDIGSAAPVSVAALDRPVSAALLGDATLPVEARLLVLAANGSEPELGAIRAALDFRGVPYDVFVATQQPALTASRLGTATHGLYQGTILTSAALAVGGASTLSAAEWAALADYEATFLVRRAVLAAWPDPALGFGSSSQRDTTAAPLAVTCTAAGAAVFRDVNCGAAQQLNGDVAYLAAPVAGAPLTPLLADGAGHALAAVHRGADGRESLLLLFRNDPNRLHSLLFLHGVLGWVAGGAYLGERRIDLSAQVDDLFFAGVLTNGSNFRIDDLDLRAARAWLMARRGNAQTPGFRVSLAFNGAGATSGDALTEEAVAQNGDWYWINHTWAHAGLDAASFAAAYPAFAQNAQLAADLPLEGFDVRDLVTPSVSGLVNGNAMRAAADLGIRYAVTDTSMPGCNNPTPNTTFYDAVEPRLLLVPRRPTNLSWNVSTPAAWVTSYNANHRAQWGRDSTYAQVLDQEADVLIHYLLRGEGDPWMFHQANLRAYDGTHSLLGDLLDATLAKLAARSLVPVGTPPMHAIGAQFARRASADTAGVRATLFRGRALVIDVARATPVSVTGVRADDGEAYGGDVIARIDAVPGTSACVPLDSAGQGCAPAPTRDGGAGTATSLPIGYCDASSLPHAPLVDAGPADAAPPAFDAGVADAAPPAIDAGVAGTTIVAIARGSAWRYWDRGGDLGTGWRARSFDDAAWGSGAGPLGYGETYLHGIVGWGPSATSKYLTTYVRRGFVVDDPAAVTALRGELMYDDGAVVYLNGTELGRVAMPAGAVTAATLASGNEANNLYVPFDWSAGKGLLVAGANTIAVEVHQAGGTSSDLVFDLALRLDTSAPPPPPPPPPLSVGGVPRGATWTYWDDGGDQGTAWRTQASPGPGWDTGLAPLGYGETYLQTPVSYGPSAASKYLTTYFVTYFSLADPAAVASMRGEAMFDDGFVAYLNGVELGRASMPTGAVTASTLALGSEANATYATLDWSARTNLLVAGTNTLAVEVHQAGATSSDLVFDLALLLAAAPPPPPPPPVTVGGVPRGATWSYWDGGGDQGTAWRTQATPGAGWHTGAAPLGYGESYLQTTVAYGPSASNKYLTTYFVTSFAVVDPAAVTALVGEAIYDDGFVAYLNGVELGRASMPAGPITATTLAPGYETGDNYATIDWTAGKGLLVAGPNVLAVEVHQASGSSSDLTFDLALRVSAP